MFTYSKNNLLLGSLKFKPLPAIEKPWQGEPPIRRSIFEKSISDTKNILKYKLMSIFTMFHLTIKTSLFIESCFAKSYSSLI